MPVSITQTIDLNYVTSGGKVLSLSALDNADCRGFFRTKNKWQLGH